MVNELVNRKRWNLLSFLADLNVQISKKIASTCLEHKGYFKFRSDLYSEVFSNNSNDHLYFTRKSFNDLVSLKFGHSALLNLARRLVSITSLYIGLIVLCGNINFRHSHETKEISLQLNFAVIFHSFTFSSSLFFFYSDMSIYYNRKVVI